MEIKKFSGVDCACEKCHGFSASIKYIHVYFSQRVELNGNVEPIDEGEYFIRSCNTCGYEWLEKTYESD